MNTSGPHEAPILDVPGTWKIGISFHPRCMMLDKRNSEQRASARLGVAFSFRPSDGRRIWSRTISPGFANLAEGFFLHGARRGEKPAWSSDEPAPKEHDHRTTTRPRSLRRHRPFWWS